MNGSSEVEGIDTSVCFGFLYVSGWRVGLFYLVRVLA